MVADEQKNRDSEQSAALPALVPIPLLAAWWSVQHQLQQEQIAAATAAGLALLWPVLSFNDLDKTTPGWLHSVTLQIERQWNESRQAGFEYFNQALLSVEPDAVVADVMADVEFPVGDVQTSMTVTGPVEVKKQVARAVPEADALEAGERKSEGAGMARAVDGGRAQVMAQVESMAKQEARVAAADPVKDRQYADLLRYRAELADLQAGGSGAGRQGKLQELIAATEQSLDGYVPSTEVEASSKDESVVETTQKRSARRRSGKRAIGWARVTDSNPCYFCAILASKGAFYLSEDAFKHTNAKYTGKGTAKVHDRCMCTMRPVFSRSDSMDERAKFFLAQWEKHGHATSDGSAENNFRKNYVPPPPYRDGGLSDSERERVLSDARNNREALLARGFKADSPNVKFFDESLRRLSAA